MKQAKCVNENYTRVRVGKNLSDVFPIRNTLEQGDAISSLLFNFALEYASRRVQVNQDRLQLNGTYQPLVYADDVTILGGNVHNVKTNAEALVASKETGLEVNADKTNYMFMSRDQKAGRSHSMKSDNSSFEWMGELIYLRIILKNVNFIQEEIKIRLKSGNACYHSVQNLLSSSLQSKNLKIKIYRSIILSVVLYGCETWSLTLRDKRRLSREKYIMRSLMVCISHPILFE
jgi:hypothetical protein